MSALGWLVVVACFLSVWYGWFLFMCGMAHESSLDGITPGDVTFAAIWAVGPALIFPIAGTVLLLVVAARRLFAGRDESVRDWADRRFSGGR